MFLAYLLSSHSFYSPLLLEGGQNHHIVCSEHLGLTTTKACVQHINWRKSLSEFTTIRAFDGAWKRRVNWPLVGSSMDHFEFAFTEAYHFMIGLGKAHRSWWAGIPLAWPAPPASHEWKLSQHDASGRGPPKPTEHVMFVNNDIKVSWEVLISIWYLEQIIEYLTWNHSPKFFEIFDCSNITAVFVSI